MNNNKQLSIGSNGYYFIGYYRVDKEEFEREMIKQDKPKKK